MRIIVGICMAVLCSLRKTHKHNKIHIEKSGKKRTNWKLYNINVATKTKAYNMWNYENTNENQIKKMQHINTTKISTPTIKFIIMS